MLSNLSPQEEEAIKRTSPRKFHRLFNLPATESHGALKISYAVAGPEDGDVPTILFCGGMFCTRWQMIVYEHLAQKEGVRIISIDRPGFGGSTPVPLSSRITIFLETTTALLSHLGIKNVSLVSHSAGTLFALNLLHYHPSLLSPTQPTLTLLSPWVHQSHTSLSYLVAASHLPDPMLNYWDSITGLIINKVSPTLASSSGGLSAFAGVFRGKDGNDKKKNELEEEERKCEEAYGMSLAVKKEFDKMMMKYIFAENTKGANDEARLCLKSTEGSGWDACEDYPEFVKNLKQRWEQKTDGEGGKGKLEVKILLAEEDALIGKKGMEYFKECWRQEQCGHGIEVKCAQTEGTDHDSILNPDKGFIRLVILAAKGDEGSR